MKLVELAGGPEAAQQHRTGIYLAGAAIAEGFADVLLTPLEATRIRLVSDRTYASGFLPALTRMATEGGLAELYAGFIPILVRPARLASLEASRLTALAPIYSANKSLMR